MFALLRRWFDGTPPPRGSNRIHRDPERQWEIERITRNLTLYHFPACPYCVKTRREIDRLGLPIGLKDINREPEARNELIEQGGKPTVPCLRITEAGQSTWMYESDDIIRYLRTRFS